MDYRKTMMEKFQKMRLRQKEIRSAAVNKKEPAPDKTKSKRERRKAKGNDEKSSRAEKNDFFNTFSLRSKRERKRKKKEKLNESKSKREKKKNTEEKSIRARKKKLRELPVTDEQKENYSNFLLEMFELGVDGIVKQYQADLKTYIPPDMSHTAFDKNMKKNRYKDVICIDKTRVVLQEGESDYIHANHVKGDPFLNSFICTQGPMKITVNDFWIMIMQEKVSNIIMLCNILEAGKNKCFQYWPQDVGSSLTFGDIQVSCSEVNDNKDTTFIISTLQAENKNIRLTIKHIRWKEWPDKGVPTSVLAPFRILRIVRQSLHRTTVVHCSAGIGRTGCIVAIEMGLQQILSGKPLFLIDMVKKLRSMRMSAIQTDEQLVYVVRCLVAYADACGLFNSKPELQEKAEKFSDEYTAMLAAKKAAREQKITAQPETERTDDQAAIMKVEEKKEEPSQKSKQSVQEVIERAAVLRLEPPKIEQKQPQPLQIFANEKQSSKVEQAPSAVPVQQIEKSTQPIPAPLADIVQGQLKQVQLIPTAPAVPTHQSQKQIQPVPKGPVVPIQQPHKQIQPVSITPAAPVQQPQKQLQQIPIAAAVLTQQTQKQIQPVPKGPVVRIQQPHKQIQPVSTTPAVPIQQPQKQIQPVQTAPTPTVPILQPQKPVHSAPRVLVVSTEQSQKQIQPVPTAPVVPTQQPQKQVQPVQTAPTPTVPTLQPQKPTQSVPTEQSQKQIQPTTPAVSTRQPQKQLPVIAKSKSTQNPALKPTQIPSLSTTQSKTSNYEPSNRKR